MAAPEIDALILNGVLSPGRGLPLYLSGVNANTTPGARYYFFRANHLKIQGKQLNLAPRVTPTLPGHTVISLETISNPNGSEIDHWFLCYIDNGFAGDFEGEIPDPIDAKTLSTLTVTVETAGGTDTSPAGTLAITPPPPPGP